MTRSMTGFGKATAEFAGELVTLEINSVNHRFLEIFMKLPHAWSLLEGTLREQIKQQVSRGKLNIFVGRKRLGTAARQQIFLDTALAEQYLECSQQLAHLMSTTQALTLDTLAQMEGVFYQEEQEAELDAVRQALETLLGQALAQMNAMREQEGKALEADLRVKLRTLEESLAAIEAQLPGIASQYEQRLHARVRELAVDAHLTQERLALEVAILADKADVSEEVVRLKAHLAQAHEHLDSAAQVGRELNFLAQEMGREINTLGAKMRDLGVTREVLKMKAELEKFREQFQNIE